MKTIIVTGTPGTGKTTVARKLARQKNYVYIDVNPLIKTFQLNTKYDKKRKSWVVDIEGLKKVLIGVLAVCKAQKISGVVIDSHLSHYLPAKYVDVCIVTRTNTKKLYMRLKRRKYSKAKIDENLECEIMEVILEEARMQKHNIKVLQT